MAEKTSHSLLIVTGLSGAGMSTSLKHLEDMGYEVFDNFPPRLINPLLKDGDAGQRPIAVGIDSRARGFDPDMIIGMTKTLPARLLFVTADDSVLQKRFTETRRRHPLAGDRPVGAGIQKEQDLLRTLKARADITIDTSTLSIHDLRRVLEGHCGLEERKTLAVTLMSFGFRFGLPREADIVMDIRFLSNPHWVPDLKPLTGLDQKIGDYIRKDDHFERFTTNFKALTEPLLPQYVQEGKTYLTIALGCTGGRHRSVYTVEYLKDWLEQQNITAHILHRDLERTTR